MDGKRPSTQLIDLGRQCSTVPLPRREQYIYIYIYICSCNHAHQVKQTPPSQQNDFSLHLLLPRTYIWTLWVHTSASLPLLTLWVHTSASLPQRTLWVHTSGTPQLQAWTLSVHALKPRVSYYQLPGYYGWTLSVHPPYVGIYMHGRYTSTRSHAMHQQSQGESLLQLKGLFTTTWTTGPKYRTKLVLLRGRLLFILRRGRAEVDDVRRRYTRHRLRRGRVTLPPWAHCPVQTPPPLA